MTTRAGFAGLLTGLTVSIILVYPLAFARQTTWAWIAVAAIATISGGWLAGRWSRSIRPSRCVTLGGLSGGLAGAIVFCLLGAGAVGSSGTASLSAIVTLTEGAFLVLFSGGFGLGALGGWLAFPRGTGGVESFDKSDPQMAMNAAITAVPASIVAGVLSVFVFSRLADSVGDDSVLDLPLAVSLILFLLSHFALTLVVPHEAREAEHVCGLDEVKMAAYVGIGAAPVFALLLFLVEKELLLRPQVILVLLMGAGMGVRSLWALLKEILPRRASLPSPQDDGQRVEAKFFGTIADSHGPRLVVLCIGCGLAMALPLHVTVTSVLINLTACFATPAIGNWNLFLFQALTAAGMAAASITLLIVIYLFYLNLGRWYTKRYLRNAKHST